MKKAYLGYVRDVFLWITGSVLFALSVNSFTVPLGFVQGGLTGVALMANRLFGFGVGTSILVLNIPLLFASRSIAGKGFTMRTFAATLVSSAVIDLSALFVPEYGGDKFLGAVFAGILSGVGLGLICLGNASTGGSDLAGILISKRKKGFSVGKLIFALDALVCLAGMFVYGNIESGMYGLVLTYVCGKLMDAVLDGAGASGGRVFFVITDNPHAVCTEIQKRAVRRITVIPAVGYYSKQKKSVVVCAVRKRESAKIYSVVGGADKNAFVLVCAAYDIRGFGFSGL